MKKGIVCGAIFVFSLFVLGVVVFTLQRSPVSDADIRATQDKISEVEAEVTDLTKQRDAMKSSYNQEVHAGQSIDISGEVEPLPVFLYMTEERQDRDVRIAQGVAKAYLSYRLLGDKRYLTASIGEHKFVSGASLDVSHLDNIFTANLGDTTRITDSYKAAPYAMTSDETVSYYAVFYYTNSGSSTTVGILFDITISKSGSIQSATAYNVYPD